MEERIVGLVQFLRGEISVCGERPMDEANRATLTKWSATACAAYRLVPDERLLDLIHEFNGLLARKAQEADGCARRQSQSVSKHRFRMPRVTTLVSFA